MSTYDTKYGPTQIDVSDMYPEEDDERALVDYLYGLLSEFSASSLWMWNKWRRNGDMLLSQQTGIPREHLKTGFGEGFDPIKTLCDCEHEPLSVTPTLISSLEMVRADLEMSYPRAVFLPREVNDETTADNLTAIVKVARERRGHKEKYSQAVWNALVYGIGIMEVIYDDTLDGGGDVDFAAWTPMEVYLDPLCEDIQDGRAVFKVVFKHMAYFKEHYPDDYLKMQLGNALDARLRSEPQFFGSIDERVPLIECWYRKWDAKAKRYRVHLVKMAAGVILENSERERKKGMFEHGMYPFVTYIYSKVQGTPWGTGLLDMLGNLQLYIDKMDTLMLQNAMMSSKLRLLVRKGSGFNPDDLSDWSREIIEGESINDDAVRWMQAAPLNPFVRDILVTKMDLIKRESGQNQASRGEVPGSVTAASAIQALQAAGQKRSDLVQSGFNNAFLKETRLLVSMMIENYDDKRMFRIRGNQVTGEEGKLVAFGDAKPAQPPEIPPEVSAIIGRKSNGFTRQHHGMGYELDVEIKAERQPVYAAAYRNQLVSSLMQAGQLTPGVGMRLIEMDGIDDVVRATEENDKQLQMLQQLQQENEQLKAEIEGAHKENAAIRGASASPMDEMQPPQLEIPAQTGAPPGAGPLM